MKNRKDAKKDRTHIKINLQLVGSHGAVSTYHSGTITRFRSILSHKTWVKVFIKVSYGKHKDVFGKMVEFTNQGTYENKHDALQALEAFLE